MGAYLRVWVLAHLFVCSHDCVCTCACVPTSLLPESAGCSTHPLSRSFALCTQPHPVAFLSVIIVPDSKHISPSQLVCTHTAQVDHFSRASASCTAAVCGCGWSRTKQKGERVWICGWVGVSAEARAHASAPTLHLPAHSSRFTTTARGLCGARLCSCRLQLELPMCFTSKLSRLVLRDFAFWRSSTPSTGEL